MPDPERKTLSATQSPALFGASPYLTRWMLLRHFIHGDPIESPEHNRMDWGKKMQPLLLAQAAEDMRLEVSPNDADSYIRYGLLGCTRDADIICPDRGRGALETKCVFDYSVWMTQWSGGKTVPKHMEIQLQQQMMVGCGRTHFSWGIIAAWVCGEMHYFERTFIPELWEALNTEARKFFDDVAAGNEGSPFGSPVEVPLLSKLFPTEKGKILDLSGDPGAEKIAEEARLYRDAKDLENGGKRSAESIRSKLLAVALDANEVILPGGVRLKVSTVERAAHEVKASTSKRITVYVPDPKSPSVMAHSTPEDILSAG